MKYDDVEGLLAMIRAYDQRIGNTATVVDAWTKALNPEITLAWASQVAIDFYAKSGDRAISVATFNARWKEKNREQSMLRGLPAFSGTKVEKDRARWWMMQGIIEGVDECNTAHSRDPLIAGILRLRVDYHIAADKPIAQRDHRVLFPALDWAWFDSVAPEYGQALGY
jgi:hypothetical protein